MNNFHTLFFAAAALVACGGQTTPDGSDASADAKAETSSDASADTSADGPITECHGYCPQPNGSACTSDCDCYEKCLGNTCAVPVAPTISCGNDAAACPPGQSCSAIGTCEGATCTTTDDCPVDQQCLNKACAFFGCL